MGTNVDIVLEHSTGQRCNSLIRMCSKFHASNLSLHGGAAGKLDKFLPGSLVAATDATRMSACCWEATMSLELGRFVEFTEVSSLPDPRELVGKTKSACFTSLNLTSLSLVLVGPRGPPL